MTGSPLTHLRLSTANSHAFCGTKCDRWTRVEVYAKAVTCKTCLANASEFHAKASTEIAGRQLVLLALTEAK